MLNKRLTCSAFWVLSFAGISWSVVESPSSENGIMHVSVGVDVVWCVTKDRKVRGLMFCFCFFLPFPCLLLSNRSVNCTGRIVTWTLSPGLGNSSSPCCYGIALWFVIVELNLRNTLFLFWKEFSKPKSDRFGRWMGFLVGNGWGASSKGY